jgi:hypothetical protein
MTDRIKREIERLLDEPGEAPAAGQGSDRVRSRLAATFSEGLADPSAAASDGDAGNPAAVAAFVDGKLTGAARDRFASALAQQPSLRADVESAAHLVSSVADSPAEVPKHLLARAGAQFAPAPPRPATQVRSRWTFSLADVLPRRRLVLAMAAVLAVIVIIPTGMMISDRFGEPGGEPELSGVEPDTEAARLQACRDKLRDAQKSKTAVPASKEEASDGPKPKDPCDPPEPKVEVPAKK